MAVTLPVIAADAPPKVPRFSVENMDKSVPPGADFFKYAAGVWIRSNPVPSDKSRWAGFDELQERNWFLIRDILERCAADTTAPSGSTSGKVGAFFASAMDTNRIEQIGIKPLTPDFDRIEALGSAQDMLKLLGELHQRGMGGLFSSGVSPDEKDSTVYAFSLGQGGLGLPDRDYYLNPEFAKQREAYQVHVEKMLAMAGAKEADAKKQAQTVLELETALAKASKSRTDLRDPISNYHKFPVAELAAKYPALPIQTFLAASGLEKMKDVIVGQPEFFTALDKLVQERPLGDWKTYLRWHALLGGASHLNAALEKESFAFYGTVLRGQPAQEPRWQRAAKIIDSKIGEALGRIYVEKYFPAEARARMNELIENIKTVFRDRIQKLEWMTDATKAKALVKFDRFTQKIGHPAVFRDYAAVEIRRDDFFGNIQRATLAESKRQLARVGQTVDKTEWHMTPQTVNAYFNPSQNEIVFPAGILQPPFFDIEMDDAINYGAIGVVIGHEITHGYDDQGRKYDAEGNLNDWWTDADAKDFDSRSGKLVAQYGAYEALPGLKVNGQLTLGENIADLGGTSIAYEALQRALAKDPSKRKSIDGFTPEQRFFLSLAQLWRVNWREAELRRRITVDPHSPGQFRAFGPHVNLQEFYDAFAIKDAAPIWRAPDLRAKIW
jgi:putative endopeptidase